MAEALDERHLAYVTPGTGDAVVNLLGNASVPANHRYTITTLVLNNVTALPATITFGRNGTAATAANKMIGPITIAGNTVTIITGPFIFEAGDSLHALQGTAAAINVDANGADHTLT